VPLAVAAAELEAMSLLPPPQAAKLEINTLHIRPCKSLVFIVVS
jgi:hypothetical protein